jgi:hypothetical protein
MTLQPSEVPRGETNEKWKQLQSTTSHRHNRGRSSGDHGGRGSNCSGVRSRGVSAGPGRSSCSIRIWVEHQRKNRDLVLVPGEFGHARHDQCRFPRRIRRLPRHPQRIIGLFRFKRMAVLGYAAPQVNYLAFVSITPRRMPLEELSINDSRRRTRVSSFFALMTQKMQTRRIDGGSD